MTTEELERMGALKRVSVSGISEDIRALGDAKKVTIDGQRMSGFLCELNARALTAAMKEAGENDWHLVFGVAYGDDPRRPVAHVWARNGHEHFDPTWSIGGEVVGYRYYALAGDEATKVADLHALEALLGRWNL